MEEIILKLINFLYSPLKLKRKIEYKKRLRIAKKFVEEMEKLSNISLKYKVSGSTERKDFGFFSDIDIDIICMNDTDTKKLYKFSHHLTRIFLKKYNYYIDCYITSDEFIIRFNETIKKMIKK